MAKECKPEDPLGTLLGILPMKSSEPKSKSKADKVFPFKRRHVRLRADLNVTLHYRERGAQVSKYAHSNGMNIGGISVYVPSELLTEIPIEVELTLPGTKRAVRLNAVVRNKNVYRYGLEWTGLTDDQRHDLRQACEWLEKQDSKT